MGFCSTLRVTYLKKALHHGFNLRPRGRHTGLDVGEDAVRVLGLYEVSVVG
jgi:hypothetical protein